MSKQIVLFVKVFPPRPLPDPVGEPVPPLAAASSSPPPPHLFEPGDGLVTHHHRGRRRALPEGEWGPVRA